MPDLRFEAIAVLVILLPGFFAARVEQRLTVNPEQREFDKTVEALIYSFFIYLVFTAVAHSFPISIRIDKEGQATSYSISASPLRLALLPLIALVLATLVSCAANHDWFGRIFRALGVTGRTWRSSIWNDVFHSQGGVVQVELADGRSVIGWLKYYSDRPENASLFLERASWVQANGEPVLIDGPGILLTAESGIRSIMFLNFETTENHT
jgi:hypothetical protein